MRSLAKNFSLVSMQCNAIILDHKLFWDNLFKLHLGLISNWKKWVPDIISKPSKGYYYPRVSFSYPCVQSHNGMKKIRKMKVYENKECPHMGLGKNMLLYMVARVFIKKHSYSTISDVCSTDWEKKDSAFLSSVAFL